MLIKVNFLVKIERNKSSNFSFSSSRGLSCATHDSRGTCWGLFILASDPPRLQPWGSPPQWNHGSKACALLERSPQEYARSIVPISFQLRFEIRSPVVMTTPPPRHLPLGFLVLLPSIPPSTQPPEQSPYDKS